MTLPSSGVISLSSINGEFGRGYNLNAYRGTGWYTDAGGSGNFPSGAISLSDFYGKRLTSPLFSFTISANQTNANLRTLAINAGWNQSSALAATIAGGVYISSNGTGTPALTISGSFPGGVSLINNGAIVGMGGVGGVGGGLTQASVGVAGSAGSPGGMALSVSSGVTVTNNGTIAGGGGGGGGGASRWNQEYDGKFWTNFGTGGGGGGGGRSSLSANASGGGGGGVSGNQGNYPGGAGGTGTVSNPGGGGSGGYRSAGHYGGAGGAGGAWGSAGGGGGGGAGGWQPAGPYGGGSGGAAVSGNGYITWAATGTRLGALT